MIERFYFLDVINNVRIHLIIFRYKFNLNLNNRSFLVSLCGVVFASRYQLVSFSILALLNLFQLESMSFFQYTFIDEIILRSGVNGKSSCVGTSVDSA